MARRAGSVRAARCWTQFWWPPRRWPASSIGDAGHTKDPCTAQGITDAFIDADDCAEVLDQGLRGERQITEGLAAWHAARDSQLIPFHQMTIQMAKFAAPDATKTALYRALANNPQATTKFLGFITGSAYPLAFCARDNLSCTN